MNYIDLFAGAGGLSEGFKQAGFTPVAHVEMDAAACLTLKTRTARHYLTETGQGEIYLRYLLGEINRDYLYSRVPDELLETVICERLSINTLKETFVKIDRLLGKQKVELIIGGPPCQVYSQVGRSRMGADKAKNDVRYTLYKEYGEFLKKFRPAMFVFENVQGLLTIENGKLLGEIRAFLRDCGYETSYEVLCSADYGVLQHRNRVILVGKRGKGKLTFPWPEQDLVHGIKIKDALFSDLPKLQPGDAPAKSFYTKEPLHNYMADRKLRNGIPFVNQHITRWHNERDLKIYAIAVEKWFEKRRRLKYNDLQSELKTHQNESSFLDRYKVVDPEGLSHTIVAHLSKDGHHFIYPDRNQIRSISVREAARIQSFPDNYFFEGGMGAAFRQIGNAVPPLLSWKLALTLKNQLQ